MSVCLSVCLCVRVRLHITYLCVSVGYERESSETDEPIEVSLGCLDSPVPINHALGGGPDPCTGMLFFGGGDTWTYADSFSIDISNFIHKQRCGV